MRVGSLFAGIGGFDLGLERAGMETVWQVEIDDYATQVLEKHWPDVKRYRDIRECGLHNLAAVDLICGGFPCQPFSVAGKQQGKEDDRYLWLEMLRIIKELRPRWVVGENVAGLVRMGERDSDVTVGNRTVVRTPEGDSYSAIWTHKEVMLFGIICNELEAIGYETIPFIIPACAVNAPHRRDRLWIVAHSHDRGPQIGRSRNDEKVGGSGEGREASGNVGPEASEPSQDVSDAECKRGCGGDTKRENAKDARQSSGGTLGGWWDIEPGVGRVADGVPDRVHRLKGLGNAVVPQISEIIGRAIMEVEGR